jgi:hypothetical protein
MKMNFRKTKKNIEKFLLLFRRQFSIGSLFFLLSGLFRRPPDGVLPLLWSSVNKGTIVFYFIFFAEQINGA